MTACKQTASMGAAATDNKSAVEEREPSRKGKTAKGNLAVKSNGAEKPKTHDLSDVVTRGLAVMSIAEKMSEDEAFALLNYQEVFWMDNCKGIYDRPSADALREKAAENWKLFNDSDKAPWLALGRKNKILLAKIHETRKTRKLTRMMTDKMMNLKM